MNVSYPVAVDNDYAVWQAFDNHYWPALYFVDGQGRIRHHRFGEGDYQESERVLQMLLAEAGADVDHPLERLEPQGVELAADWDHLGSPENYVGYERSQEFASPGGAVPDQPHRYIAPSSLGRNQWALSGNWRIGPVATVLEEPGGGIAFAFHARDLNLVMKPAVPHTSLLFRVRIDGQPPGPAHGLDVGEDGNGTVSDQRLYQLVRQPRVDRRPALRHRVPRRGPRSIRIHVRMTLAEVPVDGGSRSSSCWWPRRPRSALLAGAVTLSGCRWPPAARHPASW